MAIMGDTGNGTTWTFGTQSLSLAVKSIQVGEITIDMLDASVLATTDFMLEIASDLKKAPEVTINFLFNTLINAPTVGAAPETGTLTMPLRTGESAAANLAGTGVVTSFKIPDFQNGLVQEGSCKFKYDGDTGPKYTKATAS